MYSENYSTKYAQISPEITDRLLVSSIPSSPQITTTTSSSSASSSPNSTPSITRSQPSINSTSSNSNVYYGDSDNKDSKKHTQNIWGALRLVIRYLWSEFLRSPGHYIATLITVTLTVFVITTIVSAISRTSSIFFRMAELQVGEQDIVLTPGVGILDTIVQLPKPLPLLNQTEIDLALAGRGTRYMPVIEGYEGHKDDYIHKGSGGRDARNPQTFDGSMFHSTNMDNGDHIEHEHGEHVFPSDNGNNLLFEDIDSTNSHFPSSEYNHQSHNLDNILFSSLSSFLGSSVNLNMDNSDFSEQFSSGQNSLFSNYSPLSYSSPFQSFEASSPVVVGGYGYGAHGYISEGKIRLNATSSPRVKGINGAAGRLILLSTIGEVCRSVVSPDGNVTVTLITPSNSAKSNLDDFVSHNSINSNSNSDNYKNVDNSVIDHFYDSNSTNNEGKTGNSDKSISTTGILIGIDNRRETYIGLGRDYSKQHGVVPDNTVFLDVSTLRELGVGLKDMAHTRAQSLQRIKTKGRFDECVDCYQTYDSRLKTPDSEHSPGSRDGEVGWGGEGEVPYLSLNVQLELGMILGMLGVSGLQTERVGAGTKRDPFVVNALQMKTIIRLLTALEIPAPTTINHNPYYVYPERDLDTLSGRWYAASDMYLLDALPPLSNWTNINWDDLAYNISRHLPPPFDELFGLLELEIPLEVFAQVWNDMLPSHMMFNSNSKWYSYDGPTLNPFPRLKSSEHGIIYDPLSRVRLRMERVQSDNTTRYSIDLHTLSDSLYQALAHTRSSTSPTYFKGARVRDYMIWGVSVLTGLRLDGRVGITDIVDDSQGKYTDLAGNVVQYELSSLLTQITQQVVGGLAGGLVMTSGSSVIGEIWNHSNVTVNNITQILVDPTWELKNVTLDVDILALAGVNMTYVMELTSGVLGREVVPSVMMMVGGDGSEVIGAEYDRYFTSPSTSTSAFNSIVNSAKAISDSITHSANTFTLKMLAYGVYVASDTVSDTNDSSPSQNPSDRVVIDKSLCDEFCDCNLSVWCVLHSVSNTVYTVLGYRDPYLPSRDRSHSPLSSLFNGGNEGVLHDFDRHFPETSDEDGQNTENSAISSKSLKYYSNTDENGSNLLFDSSNTQMTLKHSMSTLNNTDNESEYPAPPLNAPTPSKRLSYQAKRQSIYMGSERHMDTTFVSLTSAVALSLGTDYPARPSLLLLETMKKSLFMRYFLDAIFITVVFVMLLVSALTTYTVITTHTSNNTYTYAMLRTLGLRMSHIQMMLLIKAGVVGVISWLLGLAISALAMIGVDKLLEDQTGGVVPQLLTDAAIIIGVCVGVLVPVLATILSLKGALSEVLVDALSVTKTSLNDLSINITKLTDLNISPIQVLGSAMCVAFGFITFYLIPQSFITNNISMFLTLLMVLLLAMLLGLCIIAALLMPYLQIAIAFVSSFYHRSLSQLLIKNIKSHTTVNNKLSLLCCIVVSFVVFAGVVFRLQAASLADNVKLFMGGTFTVLVPEDNGLSLPLEPITNYLNDWVDQKMLNGLVLGFTLIPFSSTDLRYTGRARTRLSPLSQSPVISDVKVYGLHPNYINGTFFNYYKDAESTDLSTTGISRVLFPSNTHYTPIIPPDTTLETGSATTYNFQQGFRGNLRRELKSRVDSMNNLYNYTLSGVLNHGFKQKLYTSESAPLTLRARIPVTIDNGSIPPYTVNRWFSHLLRPASFASHAPGFLFSSHSMLSGMGGVLVSINDYSRITGLSQSNIRYQRLLVTLRSDADEEEVDTVLKGVMSVINTHMGTTNTLVIANSLQLLSKMDFAVDMLELFFTVLAVIAIIMCLVTTVVNVVNNLNQHSWEMGVLRALGLTVFELVVMVVLEITAVTLSALITGTAIGLVCATSLTLLFNMFTNMPFHMHFPYAMYLTLALLLIFGAAIVSAVAAYRQLKSNISQMLKKN